MHGIGSTDTEDSDCHACGRPQFLTVDPLVLIVDRGRGCGGMFPRLLGYGHNFMNSVMI
jgi:hypothetical protein